jgi:hypothetical protein
MEPYTNGTDIQPIVVPYPKLDSLPKTEQRPIFITTVRTPEEQIWANGLFQNIFFLYKLYEAAGYLPFLMVDDNTKNRESKLYERFRTIDANEWIKAPFRIYAYVEMGLSCAPNIRKAFHDAGAKTFKLYLGNILNIDIETSIFNKDTFFCHHLIGNIDTILVSPHYDFHQGYACAINKVYPSVKIAPYVWDSAFIQDIADIHIWNPSGHYSLTIIEPNISFQKCSLLPIMIAETFFRENPDKLHEIAVINGNMLADSPYFTNTILQNLDVFKKGKLCLLPRTDIRNLSKNLRSNIVIHHTVNNEYNYIFFEHLFMGFPVIHNYEKFKDYGYYYSGNDIFAGAKMIETVINTHGFKLESYKATNKQLLWNFSIYNPDNIKGWQNIFDN